MLRFIGSLMLGTVCSMYGMSLAAALKVRRDFLTEFVTSLSVLETEIRFGRYALGDIFLRLDSEKLCGLYSRCAGDIDMYGVKRAWGSAAARAADEAGLKPGERDVISSLGAELGRSDIEGQKKAIRRTAALAAAAADGADEEYKRLGRAYRGCGLMAGLFCVIIFI